MCVLPTGTWTRHPIIQLEGPAAHWSLVCQAVTKKTSRNKGGCWTKGDMLIAPLSNLGRDSYTHTWKHGICNAQALEWQLTTSLQQSFFLFQARNSISKVGIRLFLINPPLVRSTRKIPLIQLNYCNQGNLITCQNPVDRGMGGQARLSPFMENPSIRQVLWQ